MEISSINPSQGFGKIENMALTQQSPDLKTTGGKSFLEHLHAVSEKLDKVTALPGLDAKPTDMKALLDYQIQVQNVQLRTHLVTNVAEAASNAAKRIQQFGGN
ncbi:hypothetical protein JNK13_05960 [bacterium]|nr:hypothetical protein [bacterium]